MRKVFWCSLASGVMLAGGVFTVAHFAACHPQSFAGRALLCAGRVAIRANPLSGLAPLVAPFEVVAEDAAVEAPQTGGAEQAEMAEPALPREMQPAEVAQGALVIPEPEPEAEVIFDHLVQIVRQANEVECPACPEAVAPAAMPRCHESEECEEPSGKNAPDCCETLGQPSIEDDGEEQEDSASGSTGAIDRLFHLFEHASKKSETGEISTPECREDTNHHQHYSGCPYTGHGSMHCPAGSCPQPSLPPTPAAAPGGSEESSANPPDMESSALRAIRRFSSRGLQDGEPTHPEVDTMEYRTSDAHLYEFGPGAL